MSMIDTFKFHNVSWIYNPVYPTAWPKFEKLMLNIFRTKYWSILA